jgi:hypothetical protein
MTIDKVSHGHNVPSFYLIPKPRLLVERRGACELLICDSGVVDIGLGLSGRIVACSIGHISPVDEVADLCFGKDTLNALVRPCHLRRQLLLRHQPPLNRRSRTMQAHHFVRRQDGLRRDPYRYGSRRQPY